MMPTNTNVPLHISQRDRDDFREWKGEPFQDDYLMHEAV